LDAQKKDSHRAWGLGRITRVSGWDKNDVSRIKSEVRSLDFSPFPSAQGDYEHWTSKLLDPPRLNIGLLVLFLFGFGILAAPVNLYWIAPRQKRHRLFVSVPLLSLGASALLFGFIISTEGIGGTGIRNGMLLLEPGAASAVLYQEQMARTGLINETSFPVPEDVNFLLVNVPNAIQRGSALLREGNTAAGGWFVSRAIQAHLLNRLVPSRAEVVLRQGTGKAPALLSSVNHPMGPVFYLDESHQYWKAAEISPGHAVPLEQCNKTEFETWYGTVFSEPSANLKARAKHVVGRPGWFYAQASKASDFWIPTSPQIRWMRDEMLCCGPVKAPALNTVKEVNP
jgi:hypothetical protein